MDFEVIQLQNPKFHKEGNFRYAKVMVIIMKRLIPLILISLLCTCTILLSSCGQNEAEAAAADLLDRCVACETEAVAAIMGYDILALTDIEQYTLSRMQYKIIGSSQMDSVRWDVTFDTNLFDIMALLNEAAIYTYMTEDNENFDPNLWVLQKLNTEEAVRANFRAVLPMILTEDGTWSVDTDRIGDDVRDALSGGAYSWYDAYKETFGTGEETANLT